MRSFYNWKLLIDDLFVANILARDNAAAVRAPTRDVSEAENNARAPRSPHRCLRFSNIYSARQIFVNLKLEIVLFDPPSSSGALKDKRRKLMILDRTKENWMGFFTFVSYTHYSFNILVFAVYALHSKDVVAEIKRLESTLLTEKNDHGASSPM